MNVGQLMDALECLDPEKKVFMSDGELLFDYTIDFVEDVDSGILLMTDFADKGTFV